ncbi:MAG: hypothetical protein ACXW32_03780, partial [Limisphaerales bacterium]
MKSWTLIASYLLKDTWSRWLEQPSSVLSRLFVGGLLVTVATVILVAFNLLERNLRTRLENFGVNTIVSREMVQATDPTALPNHIRPDRMAALDQYGQKLRLRQLHVRAHAPWQREITTMTYSDEALPMLGSLLHTNTPLLCFSEKMPENSLVEINFERQQGVAVVRKPMGFFKPVMNQTVLLIPQGWAPEAERIGYVEMVVFRKTTEELPILHFVSAIQNLFTIEEKNQPQLQSAVGMIKELEGLQERQAQWRSAMAGMLGLALALVFGAIAVLEFRQNAYVSALLRSFGAPGKALYLRQWLESLVLANLAAVSAILILACFHAELFGALGFPSDLLSLKNANPYLSWEMGLVLLWVNIGAFLSSLAVAVGLRTPVG